MAVLKKLVRSAEGAHVPHNKNTENCTSITLRSMSVADIRPIKKTAGNVPHVQAHRYISCRFLCSSHCLNKKKEARDGIRTRGPRLGKAMLHH